MERVSQTIQHLLRHQFIHIDDRGSAPLIEILRREATGRLIAAFFDTAGYRLVLRENEGWAGLLPDTERIAAPRMRIEETLVLLVLGRLWQEGIQEGEIGDRGSVLSTLNDAYDSYLELASRARRPALVIGPFREIVLDLGRRAIVRLGAYDDDLQNQELSIRPIVAVLVGDDFLSILETFVQEHAIEEDGETEAAATEADTAPL